MCFAKCDSGFSLALQFPDSHVVLWFFHSTELWISRWFWKWVRWSQENSQGPRNPLTSFGRIAVKPNSGDKLIPKNIGEEIWRHPNVFWA